MRKAGLVGKRATSTTANASGVYELFEQQTLSSQTLWPKAPTCNNTYTLSSDTGGGYYSNGVFPGTNFRISVTLDGIPSYYVNNGWYIRYVIRSSYTSSGKSSSGYTANFQGTAGTSGDWSGNDFDISAVNSLLTSATSNTSGYFRALAMVGEYNSSTVYNSAFSQNFNKYVYIDVYLVPGSSGTESTAGSVRIAYGMTFYRSPAGISYYFSPSTAQEGSGTITCYASYASSGTTVGYGGTMGTRAYQLNFSSGSGSTSDIGIFGTSFNITPGSTGTISATPTSDGVTEGSETFYTYLSVLNNASTYVNIGNSGVPYFTVTDPPAAPSYLTSGNKAPILGSGGATWPPSGYTELFNSNSDDSSVTVPLGFTFNMAGTGYTTAYMGSNTYVTFGAGSSAYSSLSASNPPYPKFMLGAADNSFQRVATKQSAGNWCKIRYEGNGSTSGTGGSPGITIEITLYNPSFLGTSNYVCEVLIGGHNRTGGVWGAYSASAQYATGSYAANSSYVFVSTDSTSTGFTIWNNYYVTTATS